MEGEIEKCRRFADSQGAKIQHLERSIDDLEARCGQNTFDQKDLEHRLRDCEFQKNQQLGLRHEYQAFQEEVFEQGFSTSF